MKNEFDLDAKVSEIDLIFSIEYSISNEFRPFASPYLTPTVTVPYPQRTHRTPPYPPFFTLFGLKKLKNGGSGEVR